MDTPQDVCEARDALRPPKQQVGPAVIRHMAARAERQPAPDRPWGRFWLTLPDSRCVAAGRRDSRVPGPQASQPGGWVRRLTEAQMDAVVAFVETLMRSPFAPAATPEHACAAAVRSEDQTGGIGGRVKGPPTSRYARAAGAEPRGHGPELPAPARPRHAEAAAGCPSGLSRASQVGQKRKKSQRPHGARFR